MAQLRRDAFVEESSKSRHSAGIESRACVRHQEEKSHMKREIIRVEPLPTYVENWKAPRIRRRRGRPIFWQQLALRSRAGLDVRSQYLSPQL